MMNIEEKIKRLEAEIKRVEKQQNVSAWNGCDSWKRVAACLIGELTGLRFALNLLQEKEEEVDPKLFPVSKKKGD